LKTFPLILIYTLYVLPNFTIIFLLLIPFIYGVKRIVLNVYTLSLITYVVIVYLFSLIQIEHRYIANLIGSGKLILYFTFFVFAYNSRDLFYRNYEDLELNYIRFSFIFILFSITLILLGSKSALGMRGDVGIFASLFSFFFISKLTRKSSIHNIIITLIFIILLCFLLILLQGRTAFGLLAVSILFGYLHGRNWRGSPNALAFFFLTLTLCTAIIGGLYLFQSRGGLEYLMGAEARTLAFVYWYHLIINSEWLQFLFGYGYGQCVNTLTSTTDFVRPHVEQIMASSGKDCYVSWGFHNAILAIFFEIGFIGVILIVLFISRSFGGSKTSYKIEKIFLFCLLILASPNNHLLNHDLFGALFFAALAYCYNVRKYVNYGS